MDTEEHSGPYFRPRDKEYRLRFQIIELEKTDLRNQLKRANARIDALEIKINQLLESKRQRKDGQH